MTHPLPITFRRFTRYTCADQGMMSAAEKPKHYKACCDGDKKVRGCMCEKETGCECMWEGNNVCALKLDTVKNH